MADELPTVHQAVNAVMREITEVRKDSENKHFKFKFRGIDATLGALAQPLRKHGVIIAPRLKSVDSETFDKTMRTVVEMEYEVFGPRGDSFTVCYPGEAADQGDKSVGKACSYAFKMMAFVLFAIPVEGEDDPDSQSPQLDHSQRQRFQTRTGRADDNRPAARSAKEIYDDALKAADAGEVVKLAEEAQNAGVITATVKPDDREPVRLGTALWDLKTALEAKAA